MGGASDGERGRLEDQGMGTATLDYDGDETGAKGITKRRG